MTLLVPLQQSQHVFGHSVVLNIRVLKLKQKLLHNKIFNPRNVIRNAFYELLIIIYMLVGGVSTEYRQDVSSVDIRR